MKTYQSWNGIDETLQKEIGNSAGAFTDEQGNARFDNSDNYQQDHSQLHWNEIINKLEY
jgi:iron complex outermembrane receptor protein